MGGSISPDRALSLNSSRRSSLGSDFLGSETQNTNFLNVEMVGYSPHALENSSLHSQNSTLPGGPIRSPRSSRRSSFKNNQNNPIQNENNLSPGQNTGQKGNFNYNVHEPMSNQNNNNNVFDQSRHTVSGHFGLQNVPEIVVAPTLENRMFSENLKTNPNHYNFPNQPLPTDHQKISPRNSLDYYNNNNNNDDTNHNNNQLRTQNSQNNNNHISDLPIHSPEGNRNLEMINKGLM